MKRWKVFSDMKSITWENTNEPTYMSNPFLRKSPGSITDSTLYFQVEDKNKVIGIHPPSWTKYVKVVSRNRIAFVRAKGTCLETPQSICLYLTTALFALGVKSFFLSDLLESYCPGLKPLPALSVSGSRLPGLSVASHR